MKASMPEDFKAGFLKTLWILRDYLSVIVIGGGWVSFLYHHYLLSNKSGEPIRTRDIDLLVDIKVPIVGEKSVDRLLIGGLQAYIQEFGYTSGNTLRGYHRRRGGRNRISDGSTRD